MLYITLSPCSRRRDTAKCDGNVTCPSSVPTQPPSEPQINKTTYRVSACYVVLELFLFLHVKITELSYCIQLILLVVVQLTLDFLFTLNDTFDVTLTE